MFATLKAAGRTELMAIGGTLASLVFSRENTTDLEWLHRRLSEMHNILRESPFYQEILQEGREEGRQEGREEGRQEGLEKGRQEKLQVLRDTLLNVVQARFPKMVRLAKGQAAIIDDPAALESLIVQVSIAQDAKEAKRALLDEEDEDD
jgi:flagellar biosynthesis/type III secretory pathway protein FliH